MIILLGASLTQNGITLLFETHFNINLGNFVPLGFGFLPNEDGVFGHLLQSLAGIDQEFSLVRLGIMLLYIFGIYLLFVKGKQSPVKK
jgi:hypothetical protein